MILCKVLKGFNQTKHLFNATKSYISQAGVVTVAKLPNGVRVATEETGGPLACLRLFIQVGSRYENSDSNGICHFIEHMAYKGFNSMNKQKLEHTLSHLGVKMDAITSREYQVFSGICPSECSNEVVDILAKILTDLELSEQEMACERLNIETELLDLDIDPKTVMFEYLNETAFQGTTLSRRVAGPTRNLERFNRACAYHFLQKNYTPLRIVLASSGGVSHQSIMARAGQSFCNLPSDNDQLDHGPCRFTGSQTLYRDDSMPFVHVSLAFEAAGYTSADYLPLLVAKHIIGSYHRSQGGSERHAPYQAQASSSVSCESYECFYTAYRDVGLWGTYLVCPRMSVEDCIYLVQGTWMHLCITTRDADVQRAVNAAKLELAKRADGVVNSSFDIGMQVLFKNERESLSATFEQLSALTASIIKDVAYNYIYNRTIAVSAVGPTEAIPDYNRLQAGTYWLRI
ncbi:mitochondrial-processing peptidase subunit beta-like [Zerene cesonia]|uniref:mitochondrial-processing peptidase subunit beta-like n=1 Tax=Zerene cesonia TaxID=33412 RepID=UPI0018E53BEA|nr:mitochondrial-processing peptidase subunit beta-like [Zerene cesonia]